MHRPGCSRVFPSCSSKLRECDGRVCDTEEANPRGFGINGGIVHGVDILDGKAV